MRSFVVKPALCVKGEVSPAGDKSITHRSLIIAAISQGKTKIENFPANKDCLSTLNALRKLGVKIKQSRIHEGRSTITIFGKGLYGLREPRDIIFVGDSGTTLRLILGVLAGQNFQARLTAGRSLSKRPMLRVTEPLRMMGAKIVARGGIPKTKNLTPNTKSEEYPPITISGGCLRPITYKMPVASAQVKSAILLAALYTQGISQIIEPISTRDHTERMLKLFKAGIKLKQNKIVIEGKRELVPPARIYIPGDISSASFFIVMATVLTNSQIAIKKVSLNPSRLGIIRVLKRMGADIQLSVVSYQLSEFEPMGDIFVKSSRLKGTIVKKDEIPSLIDELPILMVAACFAKGQTIFEGVAELRVKETDRIRSMSENLIKMGAVINIVKSGNSERIIIEGTKGLIGRQVRSFSDHRTAMSLVVAGLKVRGKTVIDDIECINKSFPDFLSILRKLIRQG